jgi:hypothetical protein
MTKIADRVAAGADWLDEKYPGWFNSIDLGTLEISNCYRCVLGQVYSGHIPEAERNQLIAQVVEMMNSGGTDVDRYDWETAVPKWGGFSIIADANRLFDGGMKMGFAADWDDLDYQRDQGTQYVQLLDEWTRVILERRLRAHPDLNDLTCSLAELREPAAVS